MSPFAKRPPVPHRLVAYMALRENSEVSTNLPDYFNNQDFYLTKLTPSNQTAPPAF